MGILLILHWLRHWNYQLIYPYGKIFKFLFIYFTNTYININLINILYLMLDEFCAWCCLLAKIAVDDLQDSDFDPTYGASSRGRLQACFVHLFDTIFSYGIHIYAWTVETPLFKNHIQYFGQLTCYLVVSCIFSVSQNCSPIFPYPNP